MWLAAALFHLLFGECILPTLADNACSPQTSLLPTQANCFEGCNLTADIGSIDATLFRGARCENGIGLVFENSLPGYAMVAPIMFGGPVTMSIWARFDSSTPQFSALLDWEVDHQISEMAMADLPNFIFHVQRRDNGVVERRVTSGQPVEGCRWNHFAATAQGTTMKTYLNGALTATNSFGQEPQILNRLKAYLGYNSYSSTYMSGAIRSIQVWSRALTDSEISSFYSMASEQLPTIAPCSFTFEKMLSKSHLYSPMPLSLLVLIMVVPQVFQ